MKFREMLGVFVFMISLGILFVGLIDVVSTYADAEHFASQEFFRSLLLRGYTITASGILLFVFGSLLLKPSRS